MNEIIEKNLDVEKMIYEINGKQVMLDSEIARTKWHRSSINIYNFERNRL